MNFNTDKTIKFSMNSIMRKLTVIFAYLGVIIVNALANALPIKGVTTGEMSDKYANLFAPAGITFSIWGIIYILLLGYVLFHTELFSKQKNKDAAAKISTLFIISSIANISWIFAWHYDIIWLSVLFMLTILISLIKIATALDKTKLTTQEKWFVRLPFSVYFGWITVATIANITVFFVSINWNGFNLPDVFWTILILIIGAIIGLLRTFKDKDIAYLLVFIWAYIGILIKHLNEFGGQYEGIITTLIILIGIFVLSLGYLIYSKYILKNSIKKQKKPIKHKERTTKKKLKKQNK